MPGPATLHLTLALQEKILISAARAFPAECCGLLEGMTVEDGWRVTAIHETRNLAADPSESFLVDPQSQFERLRALRGTDRRIIGCFHSHPNGRAEPSAHDRDQALETDFLWVIAAGDVAGFRLNAFVSREPRGEFAPLLLAPDAP